MNLRRVLPYTSLAVLLSAAYAGWTFYSRSETNRQIEEKLRDSEKHKNERVVDIYGGGGLKILSFNISPPSVAPSGKILVCYGVAFATEVQIEPQIEPVKPSTSRCIEAHPTRSTTYTLTARDTEGHSASAKASILVQAQ